MFLKKSFSKMLSYLARCDPHSYYIPYPLEESENQTNTNGPKI
ncbi:hypothetical protein DOT_5155 [Desulfosporosinus sp. OT]|nr:hypothetical protein DOT_5155 [Desulfosporosinus sp. OT]